MRFFLLQKMVLCSFCLVWMYPFSGETAVDNEAGGSSKESASASLNYRMRNEDRVRRQICPMRFHLLSLPGAQQIPLEPEASCVGWTGRNTSRFRVTEARDDWDITDRGGASRLTSYQSDNIDVEPDTRRASDFEDFVSNCVSRGVVWIPCQIPIQDHTAVVLRVTVVALNMHIVDSHLRIIPVISAVSRHSEAAGNSVDSETVEWIGPAVVVRGDEELNDSIYLSQTMRIPSQLLLDNKADVAFFVYIEMEEKAFLAMNAEYIRIEVDELFTPSQEVIPTDASLDTMMQASEELSFVASLLGSGKRWHGDNKWWWVQIPDYDRIEKEWKATSESPQPGQRCSLQSKPGEKDGGDMQCQRECFHDVQRPEFSTVLDGVTCDLTNHDVVANLLLRISENRGNQAAPRSLHSIPVDQVTSRYLMYALGWRWDTTQPIVVHWAKKSHPQAQTKSLNHYMPSEMVLHVPQNRPQTLRNRYIVSGTASEISVETCVYLQDEADRAPPLSRGSPAEIRLCLRVYEYGRFVSYVDRWETCAVFHEATRVSRQSTGESTCQKSAASQSLSVTVPIPSLMYIHQPCVPLVVEVRMSWRGSELSKVRVRGLDAYVRWDRVCKQPTVSASTPNYLRPISIHDTLPDDWTHSESTFSDMADVCEFNQFLTANQQRSVDVELQHVSSGQQPIGSSPETDITVENAQEGTNLSEETDDEFTAFFNDFKKKVRQERETELLEVQSEVISQKKAVQDQKEKDMTQFQDRETNLTRLRESIEQDALLSELPPVQGTDFPLFQHIIYVVIIGALHLFVVLGIVYISRYTSFEQWRRNVRSAMEDPYIEMQSMCGVADSSLIPT